jgi:FlaA1/EpsC-like NDP-sugar epimerase
MKIDLYSRTNQLIVDGLVFASAFVAAYMIRFEGWPVGTDLRQMVLWLPIVVFARLAVHSVMGIYRLVWRFVSFSDAIELAKSIVVVSACLTALRLLVSGSAPLAVWARLPPSVIVLDGLLALTASMGIRALRRLLYSLERKTAAESGAPRKRVILYGAGRRGIMLSKELKNNSAYDLIGFVDDDPRKTGSVISGTRVLGTGDELVHLTAKYQVDEIIVSMATANAAILARVLAKCRRASVPAKVMPSVQEILVGQVRMNQVREADPRPILVLGGAGYIGCWLVKRLLEEGRRVRIMNYEHWEKDLTLAGWLGAFFQKSGIPGFISEGWVESTEFLNSMIVAHKSQRGTHAKLGARLVVGTEFKVEKPMETFDVHTH